MLILKIYSALKYFSMKNRYFQKMCIFEIDLFYYIKANPFIVVLNNRFPFKKLLTLLCTTP